MQAVIAVQIITKNLHLELEVDFSKKVLAGHVILSLEKVEPDVSLLLLDVSRLLVTAVKV